MDGWSYTDIIIIIIIICTLEHRSSDYINVNNYRWQSGDINGSSNNNNNSITARSYGDKSGHNATILNVNQSLHRTNTARIGRSMHTNSGLYPSLDTSPAIRPTEAHSQWAGCPPTHCCNGISSYWWTTERSWWMNPPFDVRESLIWPAATAANGLMQTRPTCSIEWTTKHLR